MRLYVFRYMHTYMLKCVWRPREHFGYHPKEHHLPPLNIVSHVAGVHQLE